MFLLPKTQTPQLHYHLFSYHFSKSFPERKSINWSTKGNIFKKKQKKLSLAPTHFLMKEIPFSILPANSFFAFSNPTLFCKGKLDLKFNIKWSQLQFARALYKLNTYLSYSFRGPRGYISSAPIRPSRNLDAKKGSSVTCNKHIPVFIQVEFMSNLIYKQVKRVCLCICL